MLAVGLAVISGVVATVSYLFIPEKYRTSTALFAYIITVIAVITLILQTGQGSSPFLALWMVTAIFSGIFGTIVIGLMAASIVATLLFLIISHALTAYLVFTLLLAGILPILTSFVLWHGKSNNDKTKERAYYDLATELDQVANKSDVVISAISDGVIAINNKGQIELINPAAQRMVGWDHQDALNLDYKPVLQLLTADGHELDKSNDPIFEVLTTNQPKRHNDLQLQTSSGKKTSIELVASPIGRIGSGAIVVFRDITSEQAEERAQAEFISTASHEMRTPVASIEGYLGLALNPATATIDAKAHEFITKAHESAEHLGRLFQDLLDVTKADDGRLSNNPKVIDIVTFTKDIIEGLHPKAEEKKLRLFLNPTAYAKSTDRSVDPIFYVDLDADHLREVLSNLIENAIKYTPEGEVIVTIHGDDEHIVISIKDSGIGIPSEDIPHLFQKFYRVDNSATREIGGTGLGLYLCRRLTETMGGRIWVDTEWKKGSTFSVELPRISYEDANRLIEAGSKDSIQLSKLDNTISNSRASGNNDEAVDGAEGDDDDNKKMSSQERRQALGTPLILNHTRMEPNQVAPPATITAQPIAPPPETSTADPLVGASEAPAAPVDPLRPQNPMILPAAWQAMPSNLQTASPQPVAAPVPVQQTPAQQQPEQTAAPPIDERTSPLRVPER